MGQTQTTYLLQNCFLDSPKSFSMADYKISAVCRGIGYTSAHRVSIPGSGSVNLYYDTTLTPASTTIELFAPKFSTFGGTIFIDWYVSTNVVSDGTVLFSFNNKEKAALPTVSIRQNPTINDVGIVFYDDALQASTSIKSQTESSIGAPFIVDKDQRVYLKFTNQTAQALLLTYELFWIERA